MSNHPDQPQPYSGEPSGSTPPGYNAPAVPPLYPAQAPQDVYSGGNPQYQNQQYQNPQFQNQQYQNQPLPPYGQQYQQSQYPAPTYYQGGQGYVMPISGPRGLSLASMIIGLTSLFLLGWMIAPQIVGIVLGHLGLKKESPQGRAFSITGLVTNYLALVVWGGIYLFYIFIIAVLAGSSGSDFSQL